MTTIRLFSDPHLGLTRTSHTTPASRSRLKQAVFDSAKVALQLEGPNICLGDLFDTHNNDGATLLQGYEIMSKCDITLAGNHDSSNRTDSVSSMQFLHSIEQAAPWDSGEVKIWYEQLHGVGIACINHKMTQGLFDQCLEKALSGESKIRPQALLLHCNYDNPFATDDSSLNLTKSQAERLLGAVDYIFIGHEHQPRNDFGGRLVMVGNTHPTSFSDIGDKFCWDLQVEGGKITGIEPQLLWDAEKGALELDWTELSELHNLEPEVQFITVGGVAQAQHMPGIAKQVSDLWRMSDNLLMVRNSVACLGEAIEERPVARLQDIPSRISSELAGSVLEPLWKRYLGAINE